MKSLAVIFPYYINAGMLQKQVEVFNSYSNKAKSVLKLIVVDDGSPMGSRAEEAIENLKIKPQGYEFQLYRILTDLRWNWLEARNLGAKVAKADWLLLTDIDHIIPPDVMDRIVNLELDTRSFYTFQRYRVLTNEKYHPHPNSYLMTKKMYWKVGGYDETFAGHYGTDGMWRRRCEEVGSHVMLSDCALHLIQREVIPDASTTTLTRKENRDPKALEDIRNFKEEHKIGIQVLRFPWKRIL